MSGHRHAALSAWVRLHWIAQEEDKEESYRTFGLYENVTMELLKVLRLKKCDKITTLATALQLFNTLSSSWLQSVCFTPFDYCSHRKALNWCSNKNAVFHGLLPFFFKQCQLVQWNIQPDLTLRMYRTHLSFIFWWPLWSGCNKSCKWIVITLTQCYTYFYFWETPLFSLTYRKSTLDG